jgi:hypothetical protein
MAAAIISVNVNARTPHSLVIGALFDPTNTGATIQMATLIAACAEGPLKKLLSAYTDASCAGLGYGSSDVNSKKLRVYKVSGSAAAVAAIGASAEVAFVGGAGLVLTAMNSAYTGTAAYCAFELRYVNSSVR